MSRPDRNIIFARLQDVYPAEDKGYAEGWTDARVAEDLGVPRAWVEGVRREFFGDVAGNESMAKAIEDATKLLAEIKSVLATFATVTADLATLQLRIESAGKHLKPIADRADRIEKTVLDLSKTLK